VTSGVTVGVSGGGDLSKAGPKAMLNGSGSFTQSRTLTYNTQDYRIESSGNNHRANFSWVREHYATAQSLLFSNESLMMHKGYNVDHSRIKPISYMRFVPNLDVIYYADKLETGTTVFNIDSSVNIRPIYTGYDTRMMVKYYGFEDVNKRRRVTSNLSFTVDWKHPVFTGGRPVNLQLGGVDNRCLSISPNNTVFAEPCSKTSTDQSFIYDQYGRYVSARDTGYCLDANNLRVLQSCRLSQGQYWTWKPGSDQLRNEFANKVLGHYNSGELALFDENDSQPGVVSLRTLTNYTQVFALEK
jgi:hemolysin